MTAPAPRPTLPSPGDLVRVDGAASVQFAGDRAVLMRVVAVSRTVTTYDGWAWLTGYVIDPTGQASAKRAVFVRMAGVRRVRPTPNQRPQPTVTVRRGRNERQVRPRTRTAGPAHDGGPAVDGR